MGGAGESNREKLGQLSLNKKKGEKKNTEKKEQLPVHCSPI